MARYLELKIGLEHIWRFYNEDTGATKRSHSQHGSEEKIFVHRRYCRCFLFERIIERLAVSSFRNNFILKGGLLISSMIGIGERTTMDMDTTVRGIQMEEDEIVAAVKQIISTDVNDGISFE